MNGRTKNPLQKHFVTLPSQEENAQAVFWEPKFVGSAVRGEGGIWCVWRIPPFLHPLSAADPEVGTVVQIFKGFCHKELLLMNLIYVFLAGINKGLI